ncbi:MAG: hypothetical protein JWP00_4888 [Chloroflexi bacterium]|nr:hypothetical protein [Chloroflexota bacterium]
MLLLNRGETGTTVIMKEKINKTEEVNAFLDKLNHPFKAEVLVVRDIIKGVNNDITEEIKWNAPSFSYKDYMVTFNLRTRKHVHLVFHNQHIVNVPSELLEGNYPTRRMVYFSSINDVLAKKEALEDVLKELIRLIDLDHQEV